MAVNQLTLVNNTGSPITYTSVGITVPANGTVVVQYSQATILVGDSAFGSDLAANNIAISDGVYTYANTAAQGFLQSAIVPLAKTSFVPVTGSASALNGIVFSTDSTGYSVAFITANVTGVGGLTVRGIFEESITGAVGEWFQVPFANISQGSTARESFAGFVFMSSGSIADPVLFKVRISGRFLRLRLDYYTGSGSSINATAYLVSADNGDVMGLTSAIISDYLGAFASVGPDTVGGSLSVIEAANHRYGNSTDTFTATGNGATQGNPITNLQLSSFFFPMSSFSIQVVPTGAVTSWNVVLEGSLNGVNFDTILTHTNVSPGSGKLVVSGTAQFPVLYFRSRCTALALGAGTDIVVNVLGVP